MKVIVDKIGRVLIPKKIRDYLGIKPGTKLNIQTACDGVVKLELIEVAKLLAKEGGALVYQGYKTEELGNEVNVSRDARNKDLFKLHY